MIYFDNAATTPPLKGALEVFAKTEAEHFANPASNHALGHEAERILEADRADILGALRVMDTHHLVFTSGATEANNLALKGVAFRYANRGKRIIATAVEHPSVLNPLEELRNHGFDIVILKVRPDGTLDPEELKKAMTPDTILVSAMAVNNEVGSINDIGSIANVVHGYPKAFLHVDATQAIGKTSMAYGQADLFSFSGHKFGGLKGNGALVFKKNIAFEPLSAGGEQEYGFRAGTVNVAGASAMAYALREAISSFAENERKVRGVSSRLRQALSENPAISLNSPSGASPYILNFSLRRKKASVIVEALSEREIYVSSVSACSSKGEPVSYVLRAMGKSEGEAANSIRLSFSPANTIEEAERFLAALTDILERIRDR